MGLNQSVSSNKTKTSSTNSYIIENKHIINQQQEHISNSESEKQNIRKKKRKKSLSPSILSRMKEPTLTATHSMSLKPPQVTSRFGFKTISTQKQQKCATLNVNTNSIETNEAKMQVVI